MNLLIEKFLYETTQKFGFLENEYHYKRAVIGIQNKDYYPDAQAAVRYVGRYVAIEVYWYFASAVIGVTFVELQNGLFPSKRVFFGEAKGAARAINLHTLVHFLTQDKNFFLINDIDIVTISKVKKREKIINEKMKEVIENLADAIKKFALDIVSGDITIFPDVIAYQSELIKKQFP